MVTVEGVLENPSGFHLRPAQLFVEKANQFKANITVKNEQGMGAAGKSILGLMTLGLACGSKIIIEASGEDEQAAAQALLELIKSKFGE
ncbi:MAG: Phosphotransferase system, phosphocarrier protein HPr [Firmicutes bacterium]|nr:Phosphotransferase system, phosphocarrier protein HPr [Bacillota bacterium]